MSEESSKKNAPTPAQPVQHLTLTPPAPVPAAKKARAKPSVTLAKKPRKARKKKFELTRFDRDLLASVAKGAPLNEFIKANNLDGGIVHARVNELAAQGLVARDAYDANIVRLAPKGYEAVAPKLKRKTEKPAIPQTQTPTTPTPAPAASAPAPTPSPAPSLQPSSAAPNPAATPAEEKPPMPGLSGERDAPGDYIELLQAQRKMITPRKRVTSPRVSSPHPTETTPANTKPSEPAMAAAEDKCELCKSGFKLSVADSSLALYGHHFCGAAYHKECYDALLESGGSACVRCGKKLVLALDEKSEEAVKELKKLFD